MKSHEGAERWNYVTAISYVGETPNALVAVHGKGGAFGMAGPAVQRLADAANAAMKTGENQCRRWRRGWSWHR